jgi:hypothetical protein
MNGQVELVRNHQQTNHSNDTELAERVCSDFAVRRSELARKEALQCEVATLGERVLESVRVSRLGEFTKA